MKNISKIKIIYILSMVILAVLLIFAVFKPFASGSSYTEVARQSLLRTEDEWILQFDVLNHEGKDIKYTIHLLVSDKDYREVFIVRDGGKFTYMHHINENNIGSGEVKYMIYRENETSPLEQATFYLR